MATIPANKTALRKAVGRGAFAARDLAEAFEVTPVTARKHIDTLLGEGIIESAGTAKVLDAEGKPSRGRPRQTFRVAKNAPKAAKPAPEPVEA